jgi:hypothetical protein
MAVRKVNRVKVRNRVQIETWKKGHRVHRDRSKYSRKVKHRGPVVD